MTDNPLDRPMPPLAVEGVKPLTEPQTQMTEEEIRKVWENDEAPRPPAKPDPAIVAYVKHKWVQPLMVMRTACFRCGCDSPIVFVQPGQVAFGGPTDQKMADNTASVVNEMAKIGWRFELRRAYCPTCKGLGVSS